MDRAQQVGLRPVRTLPLYQLRQGITVRPLEETGRQTLRLRCDLHTDQGRLTPFRRLPLLGAAAHAA